MDPKARQLHLLAKILVAQFKQGGETEYIDQAVAFNREALKLCPPDHSERLAFLGQLSAHLCSRYDELGTVSDLEEAIVAGREMLDLCPPGDPRRWIPLSDTAVSLWDRYKQLGKIADLEEALVLDREALALCPPGHPQRSMRLNNLAIHLTTRYEQLGAMEDLMDAVSLNRDALSLCPTGDEDRPMVSSNLADRLFTLYMQTGAAKDLEEAIILDRDALELCPMGHRHRPHALINLACHLFIRYTQLGSTEDLNEAIVFGRDVLALLPSGYPDRSTSLINLAIYLQTRHTQLGTTEDLNEAVLLSRDALALRPPGHAMRPTALNNLADHLSSRYNKFGAMEDLNEAVALDREALALRPQGNPYRSASLNSLADRLSSRYKQLGDIENLHETIILEQEALELLPAGHFVRSSSMKNLAGHLFARYNHLGAIDDLDEATIVGRNALTLCPRGHQDRAQSLGNLARYLRARFTRLCRSEDKKEMFDLYAQLEHASQIVSDASWSATRAWIQAAEDFQHPSILLAYQTSLRLLTHHLAALPSLPQHLAILKNVTSSLAVDAFSVCLRNHSLRNAVELLEQGRSVFWSQLDRLRSPLDDVIASGPPGTALAEEFTRLTSLIRHALDSPGADQHDRVYRLNIELQTVVNRIRDLPDLSRFLLPSLFPDIQQAACEGPVIIVNASKYGCDALVVLHDRDPVHIPLSITKADVREMASNLRASTVRAKSMNMTREFGRFLRRLWDDVVSHIVDFLQTVWPRYSRIWWCPTAEFSLLPLHAAGPYRKGQENLSNLYISSYTSTLAALIRSRRRDLFRSASEMKHMLAIGQAKAIGENELASVGTELANIGQLVEGLAKFTRIQGPESYIARVSEELRTNEWVHFACHGLPNRKQPFASAFALFNGRFTIEQIIKCKLEDPQFAYLSACHTTVGDEESPDEVIHLASAMQFAGFRSVIGTMWAVDDSETNKITSMFYSYVKDESGRLDHTRAAFALNKTMRKLADIPLDQRILYIHLGA